MKNNHIKKEIGLAALVGAFTLAIGTTAPATFELQGAVVDAAFANAQVQDADRDNIDDRYDAVMNKDYTMQDVVSARIKAEVLRAAAAEEATVE